MALPKLKAWSLGSILDAYLLKAGGTLTGALTLYGAPTVDLHAATKKYVDDNAGSGVAFHAYRTSSADQTGIATITWTQVTCGAVAFNVGSYYDIATSRFTPPAGKYLIRGQVGWSAGVADAEYNRVAIYKNGTLIKRNLKVFRGTSLQTGEVTAMVDANGTDYFELFVYASGAGDKTISGDISYTYFEATAL